MLACQIAIPVADASQVGEARRAVTRIAAEANLNETDRGRVSIIVSELATNLVRHTRGGEILLRSVTGQDRKWIEIVSIDRGPGMADPDRCMQDGYSTGGTSGNGLGAARRLATEFEVYSAVPTGTVVFSRLKTETPLTESARFQWGVISRPATGEDVCGDTWCLAEQQDVLMLMVADGLGHGPDAAAAARKAADAFDEYPFTTPTIIIDRANVLMRGTRGGAIAVARVESGARRMRYAGIGNISGTLHQFSPQHTSRGLFSHNGTAGVQMRHVQEFEYPVPPRSLLMMYSDGLLGRWTLDPYPGLSQRHPGVIAAVLYRDFIRGRDDVTVAVVRAL